MDGIIHSTESFGAVDGPGVRFVIFVQGCRMRCQFCHNPDTWALTGGETISAEVLLKKALRYRPYWKDEGGITVSGGEPLLQIDFLLELFRLAKAEGVNTVIDTAGQPFTREEPFFSKFCELMSLTDLFLLDIKQIDETYHRALTGQTGKNILDLAHFLSENGKPMWIRHVLVPGEGSSPGLLARLGDFVAGLKTVQKFEVLPYHTLGAYKWEALGLKNPLECVEPPTKAEIEAANRILRTADYPRAHSDILHS